VVTADRDDTGDRRFDVHDRGRMLLVYAKNTQAFLRGFDVYFRFGRRILTH